MYHKISLKKNKFQIDLLYINSICNPILLIICCVISMLIIELKIPTPHISKNP